MSRSIVLPASLGAHEASKSPTSMLQLAHQFSPKAAPINTPPDIRKGVKGPMECGADGWMKALLSFASPGSVGY